jgi:hypothetical protein
MQWWKTMAEEWKANHPVSKKHLAKLLDTSPESLVRISPFEFNDKSQFNELVQTARHLVDVRDFIDRRCSFRRRAASLDHIERLLYASATVLSIAADAYELAFYEEMLDAGVAMPYRIDATWAFCKIARSLGWHQPDALRHELAPQGWLLNQVDPAAQESILIPLGDMRAKRDHDWI